MSTVKKIGIVVVISSIIGIAYYFLIKSKPKVIEKQLKELNTEKVSVVDEQLTTPLSVEEQLKIDNVQVLEEVNMKDVWVLYH